MDKMTQYGIQQNSELFPALGYQQQTETQLMTEPFMFSIMNYQNYLNLELLKNQELIASYLSNNREKERAAPSSKQLGSTSEGVDYSNSSFPIQYSVIEVGGQSKKDRAEYPYSQPQAQPIVEKKTRKAKKVSSDEDYEPEKSDTQNYRISKSSQSKNVPKNFSKAILLFIKRKQNIVKSLVEQQNFDFNEFMEMTSELKGKINSIAELRSLWLDEKNKFAKIYRILSNYYLRRFSLQHIFNSRVEDFSKHLKYRSKMSQVLKNPQDFTRMKDY